MNTPDYTPDHTPAPAPALVEPAFVSIDHAAAFLGVSQTFVHRMIARGDLPVHRFGRRVRIKLATLAQVADAAAQTPIVGRTGRHG